MNRIIALLIAALAVAAEGKVIPVGAGTAEPDMARAIAGAGPGDTVLIADGVYAETLSIKATGANLNSPITIKAENAGKALFSRRGLAGLVEGSFLRIEGWSLMPSTATRPASAPKGEHLHSLTARSAGAGTIDGKSWGDGLQLFDSTHCLIERCHIHHCLASAGGERKDAHGIRITHSRDIIIRNTIPIAERRFSST